MKTLFDQMSLSGMQLNNRLVRSATASMDRSDDGSVNPKMRKLFEDLARGGVGLIITGLTHTTTLDADMPIQFDLTSDQYLNEYAELINMIHSYGAKIAVQLAGHGSQIALEGDKIITYGPSSVMDKAYKRTPVALSVEQIKILTGDFAKAASRAKKCGFDGVQLHAAHGYLLSKFLTPYYNKRRDEYGGSLENRARIILEIYEAIRAEVGEKYPVMIKVNCEDFMDEGFTFEECICLCEMLDEKGIDAIEISGGTSSSRRNKGPARMHLTAGTNSYFVKYADVIARLISAPVMLVGGNRDPHKLEQILQSTWIEYISLCRPLIREPNLPARWRAGDLSPSTCISCSRCLLVKDGNYCAVDGDPDTDVFNNKK